MLCTIIFLSSPFGCCPQGLPQQITCLYLTYHLPLQLKNLPFKSSSFFLPYSSISNILFPMYPHLFSENVQTNLTLPLLLSPNRPTLADLRLSNLVHSGHFQ
ncbi:hypothetical protein AMECASPLE_000999 [Ameca splendens]|uniref:Uncharacterized protein n=1 Tax=Ameca splendens TaxID=208324 RepID=A0ABV0Z900_9TELE